MITIYRFLFDVNIIYGRHAKIESCLGRFLRDISTEKFPTMQRGLQNLSIGSP